MPTLEHVRDRLQKVQAVRPEETILRANERGKIFADVSHWFERLIQPFQLLPLDTLEHLNEDQLDNLESVCDATLKLVDRAERLSVGDDTGVQAILREVKGFSPRAFNTVLPLALYDFLSTGGARKRIEDSELRSLEKLAESERRLTEKLATAETARLAMEPRIATVVTAAEGVTRDATATLNTLRDQAAKTTLTQQADHFAKAATFHASRAKAFGLAAAAGLVVLLGVVLVGFLAPIWWEWMRPTESAEWLQLAIAKALAFLAVSSAVLVLLRASLAHRHNAVVNAHRQNALLTYKALAGAADTSRDAILAQAAACIFSPQPTGFAKPPSADSLAVTRVTSVFGKDPA